MTIGSIKIILHRRVPAVLLAGSLLSVPALPAAADVALMAQEVAGMGQTPPVPQTIKLFYKGANARLEVSGEPTLLLDGKGNILYGLNPSLKTYYLTVPTQVEPTVAGLAEGGAPAKEEVKLDLSQTGQTMTFAGATAHQYTVTGTVTYPRNRSQGSRRGGGRRRGGGFPGGGFPLMGPATVDQNGSYSSGRGGTFTPPQWSISGELWLSDTDKFPAKEDTLFAAQLAAASSGPFQQPLADALDKHKGLPLLARITVTYTPASSAGRSINQYGGVVDGAAANFAPTTTVTTFTVQSISTAPLDDKIFRAPLDYTLVAAPPNPYVPGTPVTRPQ